MTTLEKDYKKIWEEMGYKTQSESMDAWSIIENKLFDLGYSEEELEEFFSDLFLLETLKSY